MPAVPTVWRGCAPRVDRRAQPPHRRRTGRRHRRRPRWTQSPSTRPSGARVPTATLRRPPAPPRHRAAPVTLRKGPSRLWRSPADEPRWARPALLALLAGTALLYLWDLSASGYANDYYAAAVQAGTQSLKAWLFGSLDAGNAITVDKPPAAL